MKRLWAGTLGLALAWQASDPLVAEPGHLGIALGRPQPLKESGPVDAVNIQLTTYRTASVPTVQPTAASGSSHFAVDAVWGTPPQRLTPAPMPPASPPSVPHRSSGNGVIAANVETVPVAPTPVAPEPGLQDAVTLPTPIDDCACDACCDWGCAWGHAACRWYGRAEYLLWWLKSGNAPPLVTVGPLGSGALVGALGTTVLVGGAGTTAQNAFSGGRFTLGIWCDPAHQHAIESTYFFLGEQSTRYAFSSQAAAVLARPFFSLNTLTEASKVIAAPGVSSGGVAIDAPSRFWGTELNWRCNLLQGGASRLDLLTGIRYLELDEGLLIVDTVTPVGGGTSVTMDNFDTFNRFLGGQIGLQWESRGARWSIDLRSKVALGGTRRNLTIAGSQFDGGTLVPGGLLALSSNAGRFHQERFAAVPEFGLNIGYQCTEQLRLTIGYTFIYWGGLYRPGDQIDRVLDTSLVPGAPPVVPSTRTRPAVPMKATDFFAQGMNFGLEYRY